MNNAKDLVDRVQELRATFNEKAAQPFLILQREANECGSNEIPVVRAKFDEVQQAFTKAYQTIDFTGDDNQTNAAMEAALTKIAEVSKKTRLHLFFYKLQKITKNNNITGINNILSGD